MRARINGADLAFDDQGAGDAVLFVHGHPFNRSMWAPQVEALRSKLRVVTPDLRGYGDSSLGADSKCTLLETFGEDLAGVLDVLGISRAAVVGLSMGGQIAMEFARAFPHRLTGLVLVATSPQAESAQGIIDRNRIADRIVAEGMAEFGCEVLPKLIGRASMSRMPHVAANVYRMICSTDPVAAAAALRGRAKRRDYRDTLSDVSVPALVVVGTDDGYTTFAEAQETHELLANSSLEILEGIGHMPNLEDAQRFNVLLERFLTGLRAAAR